MLLLFFESIAAIFTCQWQAYACRYDNSRPRSTTYPYLPSFTSQSGHNEIFRPKVCSLTVKLHICFIICIKSYCGTHLLVYTSKKSPLLQDMICETLLAHKINWGTQPTAYVPSFLRRQKLSPKMWPNWLRNLQASHFITSQGNSEYLLPTMFNSTA